MIALAYMSLCGLYDRLKKAFPEFPHCQKLYWWESGHVGFESPTLGRSAYL